MQYIYALQDPSNLKIRYIGKTVDPKRRFRDHISSTSLNRSKSRKNSWIKNLKSRNLFPKMVILDHISDDLINEAEKSYIEFFQSKWLTNGTAGGTGGAVADPEARERIRQAHLGKSVSDETKKKMSLSQKRRYENPEERQKTGFQSSLRGAKPPLRQGEANNAKLTELEVQKIRQLAESGLTARQVWEKHYTNLTYQTIWMVVKRKTWNHV